ncbi:MAG: 50S ribosomal protein L32 [Proteobacteria bacterium]|nr:50S ribosomal protein L32 [Pseudomonadota bacterium]
MAVPKGKISSSRRGQRRSHDGLDTEVKAHTCSNCGEFKQAHNVCEACGTYNGKQVVKTKETAEVAAE